MFTVCATEGGYGITVDGYDVSLLRWHATNGQWRSIPMSPARALTFADSYNA